MDTFFNSFLPSETFNTLSSGWGHSTLKKQNKNNQTKQMENFTQSNEWKQSANYE